MSGDFLAGRRTHSDLRNSLTEADIKLVEKLQPGVLLIENVRGFTLPLNFAYSEKKLAHQENGGATSPGTRESGVFPVPP
jgi:site-specific DNA-cytosine methylase